MVQSNKVMCSYWKQVFKYLLFNRMSTLGGCRVGDYWQHCNAVLSYVHIWETLHTGVATLNNCTIIMFEIFSDFQVILGEKTSFLFTWDCFRIFEDFSKFFQNFFEISFKILISFSCICHRIYLKFTLVLFCFTSHSFPRIDITFSQLIVKMFLKSFWKSYQIFSFS